ncbi:hypothetical protein SAY87_030420 [Trapa incisa]|uniref:Uncharacterized protein n=1 Tax=Trapa incisa TaxID=236973 RepID=A0AAN7KIK4_9MYRT|nr:hypothetical protein SAY87_030403 [Trapa incisa]KAK4769888.1 hypothetical protein SAY87_030420 [Trapa incisa]
MEFPFGSKTHTHTHHHRGSENDYEGGDGVSRTGAYPPPSQPPFNQPPPPYFGGGDEFLSQPPSNVYRSSHIPPPCGPYPPPGQVSDSVPVMAVGGGGSVKVICKADSKYALAIRDGKVILASCDPKDPTRQWDKYTVKDEDGFPCFSLVNKATFQAIKHYDVFYCPKPNRLDRSILWKEREHLGDGYRAVVSATDPDFYMDALNGDRKQGGVHDGTPIVVLPCNDGDDQGWKFSTQCKLSNTPTN